MVQNSFDAAQAKTTIFTPDGETHETTRLNAVELVRDQGYFWKPEDAKAAQIKAETVVEAAPEKVEEPVAPVMVPEAVAETPATPEVDAKTDPLADVAMTMTGGTDVAKYLEGFTADALRTLADERYGEKIDGRMGKAKIVEKIEALEAAKLADAND